eukprot:350783-Chlamydomonas_euryale.AAC.2
MHACPLATPWDYVWPPDSSANACPPAVPRNMRRRADLHTRFDSLGCILQSTWRVAQKSSWVGELGQGLSLQQCPHAPHEHAQVPQTNPTAAPPRADAHAPVPSAPIYPLPVQPCKRALSLARTCPPARPPIPTLFIHMPTHA